MRAKVGYLRLVPPLSINGFVNNTIFFQVHEYNKMVLSITQVITAREDDDFVCSYVGATQHVRHSGPMF